MAQVTYIGPDDKNAQAGPIYVDGHRFDPGVETEVSDKLATELAAGEGRLSGHNFEVSGKPKPKAKAKK